jgi:cytochrome c-type biogenesis protein CcmE
MSRKRRRLLALLVGLALIGAGTAMVLAAFRNNLVFFYSPSDLAAKEIAPGRRIRIGGLVEEHSVVREADGRRIGFRVTDGKTDIAVTYDGALPDLFREGQGVVAEGRLSKGIFVATSVLAKHDEKYMPPEVADALKKAGRWQEGGSLPAGKPIALPAPK